MNRGVVDVVMVTFNSADTVAPAVSSVRSSELVSCIVVIDNASSDQSAAIARVSGADTVLESGKNIGFAAGVNLGLARVNAEYVLLLNPDAVIAPSQLHALVDTLALDEGAVLIGPVLLGADGARCLGARRFSTALNRVMPHIPVLRKLMRGPEYDEAAMSLGGDAVVVVDYLWGACLLARRDFLEAAGGLDERYFMYSEDEDLGRTAVAEGKHSLLALNVTAQHIGAVSSAGRNDLVFARQVEANASLLNKWKGNVHSAAYRVGILGALILLWVSAGVRRDRAMATQVSSILRILNGRTDGGL